MRVNESNIGVTDPALSLGPFKQRCVRDCRSNIWNHTAANLLFFWMLLWNKKINAFEVLNPISKYYNIWNFHTNLKYLIKYFWHVCTTITISKSGLAEVRGKASLCTVTTPMMNNPVSCKSTWVMFRFHMNVCSLKQGLWKTHCYPWEGVAATFVFT